MEDKDKTILANEAEIKAWLVAQGFSNESDAMLYSKDLPNGNRIHWDFRNQPKGTFYGWNKDKKADIPDDVALAMPEYIGFRRQFTPSMPVKEGTAAPIQSSSAPSSEKPKRASKTAAQQSAMPPAPPASSSPVRQAQSEIQIVDREDEAYTLMNLKDDEQVLAEMQGKYLDELVYSFQTGNRNVIGLSWAGVKETVRSAGNIEIENVDIQETPDRFRILAKGRDTARHVTMFGIAEQSKKMKLKDDTFIDDPHALSKCLSRAQRNALRSLIPEMVIKTTIDTYLQKKKNAGRAA